MLGTSVVQEERNHVPNFVRKCNYNNLKKQTDMSDFLCKTRQNDVAVNNWHIREAERLLSTVSFSSTVGKLRFSYLCTKKLP